MALCHHLTNMALTTKHLRCKKKKIPACRASCVCPQNWPDLSLPALGLSPPDIVLLEQDNTNTLQYTITSDITMILEK